MAEPELSYCAREVRRHDNDRFLTALFAPADRREDLLALYAFNLEVAKTREVVSEATLGLIRLQWWRESLEGIQAGQPRRHEVIQPLAAAMARHGLDGALLDRLIDAREADLEEGGQGSLDCLTNYADATGTPLVRLALQVLGAAEPQSMEVARHVGIAWSLTGIARAVPFQARAQRSQLPADLMAANGVTETALFQGLPEPGLTRVVEAVADRAREHLAQARALRRGVPKAGLPALLPATLADLYLGALAKAGHDPFAPRILMPHPFRQLRLAWAAATGRW